jgi:hypothetical protein
VEPARRVELLRAAGFAPVFVLRGDVVLAGGILEGSPLLPRYSEERVRILVSASQPDPWIGSEHLFVTRSWKFVTGGILSRRETSRERGAAGVTL